MKILITGGACAGKTTCIEYIKKYLEERKYYVVVFEEIPTKMITNNETPELLGKIKFLKEVIRRQLKDLEMAEKNLLNNIYIFDGSPIDCMKFISKEELQDILEIYNTNYDEVLNKFDYIIHLESVSKKIPNKYSNQNNIARTTDVNKSAERDELLLKAYEIHTNRYIIPVYDDFAEKLNNFKKIIDEIMGKHKKL